MKEMTIREPNPAIPGSDKVIRIRQERNGEYSIGIGGADPGDEPSSMFTMTGITPELMSRLPAAIAEFLSED